MTAKDKAKELANKFYSINNKKGHKDATNPYISRDFAKECAIIAVSAIIESNPTSPLKGSYIEIFSDMVDEAIEFWTEVKQELEKL